MSESIPLARGNSPNPRHTAGLPTPSLRPTPSVTAFDLEPEENAKGIRPPWKRNLYMLLEQPASSPSAFVIHVATTALIILSAVVTVLETVPLFHSISGSFWFGMETSLVALFTVEYIARCVSHSNTWSSLAKWVISFFGVIDLLGIVPYYIEIAMQQDTSTFFRFTILRTFRLLRVFRPFRHNNTILLTIEVMYLSFRRSQHALLALAFFVVMVLVVFSTLLYFTERGTWDDTLGIFINSDGDPSQFASIPAAAWFVLVTITTVGYGEITPRSFLGRLVTLPLLVFGLLLIALPTFVLGREFSIVWDMMMDHQTTEEDDFILTPTVSPIRRRTRPRSDVHTGPLAADFRDSYNITNRRHVHPERADLSSQVAELKATVDMQNELIHRILEMLDTKGKQRAADLDELQGRSWS